MSATADLRLLAPEDSLEDLTGLLHRAYRRLGAMGLNYTAVDQTVETTRDRIRGRECWVATMDGRIAGTVTVALPSGRRLAYVDRPGVACVLQLAVDPERQGHGLGSRLLAHAEARARAGGAVEMVLDTAEGAQHLLDFYAARGYAPSGLEQFEGKAYRSVILRKALRD